MYFLDCLYFKHTYLLNNILKNADFCSFFQINTNSFEFLNKLKKNLYNLNLQFVFCKKNKMYSIFNKIIKGVIYVLFCLKICKFSEIHNLFIQFIYENNPKIICISVFLFKQFLHFNQLKSLYLTNLIFNFFSIVNFFFFKFYILVTIYAKKI